MNIIAAILIIVFFPFNYFFAGYLNVPAKNIPERPKVEGATSDKAGDAPAAEKSFKGSLEKKQPAENANPFGYVPERKNNFSDIKIAAGSSVVIDGDSGTILHYENGRAKTPIASLTKIMTSVIVMENVKNLDEQVTIDEEALKAEGTKVGCPTSYKCTYERLRLGEKVTVKNLLTAMLLDSANDAAIALGKHVAVSQKGFADLMNRKAEQLNLSDTHFCNPTGLDEEGCYSSAYDLARIAAYSMRYSLIWDIMNTQAAKIASCDGSISHQLKNTDLLLGQIPNCLGGKTGFTYNAGKSLMMAAVDPTEGRHKIIAVLINDNNRWTDMTKLVKWTFENYDWK